jgi:hypothetical protein
VVPLAASVRRVFRAVGGRSFRGLWPHVFSGLRKPRLGEARPQSCDLVAKKEFCTTRATDLIEVTVESILVAIALRR